MKLEEFKKFRVHPPPKCKYLGMWEDDEVCFVVFSWPNRTKLRVTYWKAAQQLLVCVKDYLGVYKCIGNNVKKLEDYQEILTNFDWRKFDAGIEKAFVKSDRTQETIERIDEEELRAVRANLASLNEDNVENIPNFGMLE